MYVRHDVETRKQKRWQLWFLKAVQTGLVAVGVVLFVAGMAHSLGVGGAVDPGAVSFGDDTDGDSPGDSDDPGTEDGGQASDGDTDGGDEAADGDDTGTNDEAQTDDDGTDEREDERSGENGTEDEPENEDESTEPETASLTLTVVGPAGERIEDAEIRGEGEPHEADIPLEFGGETDSDGTYTTEIYENEYAIDVDHPAYEATTIDHAHDGDNETTVELDPDGNDGTAPSTARLTIRIVDPDGDPIDGVSVHGEGEPHEADIPLEFSGETDSDGTYTDVIYENEYTIEVSHPDYEGRTGTYTHDGDMEDTVELEPREREDDHP
ncbi:hypothetical protein [Halomontanus rarus]|uniref:hypothetical protein n=1 Tax=Halomontanus rarus TaxID=3034020 RepID=UPI001A99E84E